MPGSSGDRVRGIHGPWTSQAPTSNHRTPVEMTNCLPDRFNHCFPNVSDCIDQPCDCAYADRLFWREGGRKIGRHGLGLVPTVGMVIYTSHMDAYISPTDTHTRTPQHPAAHHIAYHRWPDRLHGGGGRRAGEASGGHLGGCSTTQDHT